MTTLAEVYLELIGGRQPDFGLSAVAETKTKTEEVLSDWRPMPRGTPLASRLTQEEAAAHDSFIEKMGDGAIWKRYQA